MNRDIIKLSEQTLLRDEISLPTGVQNRVTPSVKRPEEKRCIARRVASYVPDQASLFLHLKSAAEEVAKALLNHKGLRVITNNLNVAAIMSGNIDFEVIIAAGLVRRHDQDVIDETTIDFIRQFRADFGIIEVAGIDSDGTLLDFDYHDARVAEAVIANSRQVLLVADRSKFGCNALVRLGHLSQINALFTDQPVSEDIAGLLDEVNADLYVAEP